MLATTLYALARDTPVHRKVGVSEAFTLLVAGSRRAGGDNSPPSAGVEVTVGDGVLVGVGVGEGLVGSGVAVRVGVGLGVGVFVIVGVGLMVLGGESDWISRMYEPVSPL